MRLYHKKISSIEELRAERKRLDKQAKGLLPDMSLIKKGGDIGAAFASSSSMLSLALPILKQLLKSYDKAKLAKITTKFLGKFLKWEIKAAVLNALLDVIIPSKKAKRKTES